MEKLRSINAAGMVYGEDQHALDDDPAETYHEASKLYPTLATRQIPGVFSIESNPGVMATVTRAGKRFLQAEQLALPQPEPLAASLGDLLRQRRSHPKFGSGRITLAQLATLLHAAYGVVASHPVPGEGLQTYRTAPSGGALFPLDLWVAAHRVDGLAEGVYHYEPLGHVLERVRSGDARQEVIDAFAFNETVGTASFSLFVSAAFWRSRFKYGLRSYRFVLLEAGHVVQNLLLAAEALGLAGVALGGFYDTRADALLDLDGVNEGVVYSAAIGTP